MNSRKICSITLLTFLSLGINKAVPQQIQQDVFDIFRNKCSFIGCHPNFENEFPGRENNSIYQNVKSKYMPKFGSGLKEKHINTIKYWIDAGSPRWKSINQLDSNQILNIIKDHLDHLDNKSRYPKRYRRYFIVTHNRKSDFIALTILLNRLSWQPRIVYPKIVDGSYEMIFFIDVRESWGPRGVDKWQDLESYYQDDGSYQSNPIYDEILDMVKFERIPEPKYPIMPIDWFLENVSKPPLYHKILELPEYEKLLTESGGKLIPLKNYQAGGGFNVPFPNPFDIRRLYDSVAIFEGKSKVAYHNRIFERILFKYPGLKSFGVYYRSYDFDSNEGSSDITIFSRLGSFSFAGGEMIFTLPNGLHGYFITNNSGKRLSQAPTEIVVDARGNPIINGSSCMTCHNDGFIEVEEEVINHDDPYIDRETMNNFIRQDNIRYQQVINDIEIRGEQLFGQASLYYGVAPELPTTVTNAKLGNNYPNPFNPETWIPYSLDQGTNVIIEIYVINGQLVRRLNLGYQSKGVYMSQSRAAYWDGTNGYGERVASGIYYYTIATENFTSTKKMVVAK